MIAERPKATVCGLSLAGIAGSNPAGSMDVCVVCCAVKAKAQEQEDPEKRKEVREKYKARTREGSEVENKVFLALTRYIFFSKKFRRVLGPIRSPI